MRKALEHELEFLTLEEGRVHKQLMNRWKAGDPAFGLNRRNVDLLLRIKKVKKDLEKVGPKE